MYSDKPVVAMYSVAYSCLTVYLIGLLVFATLSHYYSVWHMYLF